jgi:DNA mismatch endonuclease (patch repair protein)
MKVQYIRDGRAPIPKSELTSRIMSKVRAKNTRPELLLRRALWKAGLRGYRLHWKYVPGRPDICFTKKKVAVFVNGCFWHSCPNCKPSLPRIHRSFWRNKFQRNKIRDTEKLKLLRKAGWKTLVFWECQIQDNTDKLVLRVMKSLGL